MIIPESVVLLAGFVLAHAAWSVSDLPQGDLLTPLAMVEEAGQRRVLRFEAETQERAIANAKSTIAKQEASLDSWAFAREGRMKESSGYVDVLTIEAKARGMKDPIVFVQRFQPFARGEFRLLGNPTVVVAGNTLSPEEAAPYLQTLMAGVRSHGKVAPLWPSWVSSK